MELHTLLKTHWFDLLQSAAIVSGFVYTALSFSLDLRGRRAESILRIGSAHREIWTSLMEDPDLERILDPEPNLDTRPLMKKEEHFVLLALLHLTTVHQAIEFGLHPKWPGFEEDIRGFFSLPIPSQVLKKYLPLQTPGFQRYLRGILGL